jgi:hypothetical protein
VGQFDDTCEGVNAQHAYTRLLGLPYVSREAPENWAWELVGYIGLGFSGVTTKWVLRGLSDNGWLRKENR